MCACAQVKKQCFWKRPLWALIGACSVKRTNTVYRNDPKFSDRQFWANSADPDQTAPIGAV